MTALEMTAMSIGNRTGGNIAFLISPFSSRKNVTSTIMINPLLLNINICTNIVEIYFTYSLPFVVWFCFIHFCVRSSKKRHRYCLLNYAASRTRVLNRILGIVRKVRCCFTSSIKVSWVGVFDILSVAGCNIIIGSFRIGATIDILGPVLSEITQISHCIHMTG